MTEGGGGDDGGVKILERCASSAPGFDSPQAIYDYLEANSYQGEYGLTSEAFTVMDGGEVWATMATKDRDCWLFVNGDDYYQICRDGKYCGSYD